MQVFRDLRHPRPWWTVCTALWLCFTARALPADEVVLFSFDTESKLAADWSAVGKINVRREAAPEFAGEGEAIPAANGIFVDTDGEAGVFAKSGRVPRDWQSYRDLSFWVYRSEEEAKQRPVAILEMQLYEPGGEARAWRRIDVDHTGWKQITVPLRWFRWGDRGRIPRWDQIDRIGFWFRDATDLWIDSVTVTPGPEQSAYLAPDELRALAFPDRTKDETRVLSNDSVLLLTDAPQLDAQKLGAHCARVAGEMRKDFAFLPAPSHPPTLVVFASQEQYRRFVPRFAQQFNSTGAAPATDGFTLHGIATSYWNEEYGTLRPVFTHEYIHAFLSQSLRLNSRGDWLHEGLATMYQLRFHPQDNVPQIVREGVAREGFHSPLKELCTKSLPTNRYWQAMTVVEMLSTDEKYRDRFADLIGAIQQSGSAELEPHLLQTTWQDLTENWKEFCRAKYGAEP